jgi:hypothetical protein
LASCKRAKSKYRYQAIACCDESIKITANIGSKAKISIEKGCHALAQGTK